MLLLIKQNMRDYIKEYSHEHRFRTSESGPIREARSPIYGDQDYLGNSYEDHDIRYRNSNMTTNSFGRNILKLVIINYHYLLLQI